MTHDSVSTHCFSPDYGTARHRFLEAAQKAGGKIYSLDVAVRGPNGEPLSIDIGWFGSPEPRRVLLHSSGVHGVEAFAGSAIQLQWLADGLPELPQDAAIIIVHVINPYGMAWLRRYNENNVDLNRNFLAPHEAYTGAPPGYQELDSFLNPKTPPSGDFYYLKVGMLIVRHGMSALKHSVAGGQYENPKGLFFGGHRLEEGPRKLQDFLSRHLEATKEITVVDIHTGLGPYGYDTLMVHADDETSKIYQEMKEAYGERVSPLDPEKGVAYRVKGSYDTMFARVQPNAEARIVCQEFGTLHSVRVLKALREESRWAHYGDGNIHHPTKVDLKEAFVPTDPEWRLTVLERGAIVIQQARRLADL